MAEAHHIAEILSIRIREISCENPLSPSHSLSTLFFIDGKDKTRILFCEFLNRSENRNSFGSKNSHVCMYVCKESNNT